MITVELVRGTQHRHAIDPETVQRVKKRMKPEKTMTLLAETFRTLGDPTRAAILYALVHGELCVCDLAEIVGISESAISHHLRVLRNLRLVNYRRQGRKVCYSLADDHIRTLLAQGLQHVEERL
ncbi:MAG: metalloregulator ArsR/SmtB family transcription factor [Armatimonadota bacterium]|nr:metalloregulator ArsR/SmtB family transcription factor [Armatimonadota bacterium]MDR5702412.1 metalloregulator ArsR/SmtB family transcription factor [Armatimonadota bacterium]MDR7435606.1 metalloregulator ArsR/SmtB family transcription factor [Armatimonadota bacterium]